MLNGQNREVASKQVKGKRGEGNAKYTKLLHILPGT